MSQDDMFLIYQLKDKSAMRDFRFEPLKRIKEAGLAVERGRYNYIYAGTLEPGETLGSIYERFNIDHPADFMGHSLSMSDVVVIHHGKNTTAHYVDRFGFTPVPEFLEGPYKYYSTQRPVDIGTFPKTENGPVQIINFDKRAWVENATFRAWGYLAYDAPLPQKQIDDYELRAAPDNPDHVKPSPYQLEAQAQIVGKWEQSRHVADVKRLTWWHSDFGVFVKKEFVAHEQLAERFGQVIENRAKPITERMKEGAEQAAKDNAARPAPVKNTEKDR